MRLSSLNIASAYAVGPRRAILLIPDVALEQIIEVCEETVNMGTKCVYLMAR